MTKASLFACAGALGLMLQLSPQDSDASFLGHTLQIDWRFPNLTTHFASVAPVVDGAIEFPELVNGPNIDVGAFSIDFFGAAGTSFNTAAFNGFIFTDISGFIPSIIGVTIASQIGYTGFDLSRISFSADEISLNFVEVGDITDPARLTLAVQFADAVPEPATGILTGLALAAIGLCRTRVARRL